ncbi:adenylyl-sulfate kinase [Undibacterium sp. JH2W]|uniref:adenylyl-sulfate kinase n=1 Tax=Undibacterium sp. JH2W TaxID=3413037 RepID=UPI003BF2012F
MPGSDQTESYSEPATNVVKTWWLSGLPGAGKTTLAQSLANHLREQYIAVCVLDGDEIRQGLSKDLGFSQADREEQSRRTAEVARLLNLNGISAIVALVAPSLRGRALAREIIGNDKFVETYVSTPLHVCQQRDPKGWYARAKLNPALQLTGVSSPYEAPAAAECVIDTSQTALPIAIQQLSSFLKA